jgi:DNA polymerase II
MSFVKLDDYKLETAAKHFLGEGKLIEGSHKWEEIENCYLHHPQKLIDYNLHDARITLELIKKSTVLELTIRRSMLTRMQPDRVNASIASLDSLYLKELQKRKIVAPSALSNEREDRIKGGFVMTSKPGIYDNILVLDFKSLYPSIIRTFNIDPFSYVDQKHLGKYRSHDVLESPNKAHFRKQDGILPFIIEDLWKQRDEAKKRKDKLAANAVKILMNSFFGVLANPQCRFYSMAIANAITHFGQFLIKLCAEKIEELGHEVIYGDTDSIFVKTKEKETAKAKKIGIEIQDYINAFYKAYVQKHYGRESFLELEFEKVYRKFLMPTVRHGEEGAKKRYAGLLEKDGSSLRCLIRYSRRKKPPSMCDHLLMTLKPENTISFWSIRRRYASFLSSIPRQRLRTSRLRASLGGLRPESLNISWLRKALSLLSLSPGRRPLITSIISRSRSGL